MPHTHHRTRGHSLLGYHNNDDISEKMVKKDDMYIYIFIILFIYYIIHYYNSLLYLYNIIFIIYIIVIYFSVNNCLNVIDMKFGGGGWAGR